MSSITIGILSGVIFGDADSPASLVGYNMNDRAHLFDERMRDWWRPDSCVDTTAEWEGETLDCNVDWCPCHAQAAQPAWSENLFHIVYFGIAECVCLLAAFAGCMTVLCKTHYGGGA